MQAAGSGTGEAGAKAPLLILACGALAREILDVLQVNGLGHIDVQCLPASLHNRPGEIAEAVRGAIRIHAPAYGRILVGYADCGTGGALDRVLAEEGVERLPGPHCYAFYSGIDEFTAREGDDMRVFYLTDFLVRQFDSLVVEGLGLDRHPELRDTYFQHYRSVVYLSQVRDPELLDQARRAADRLQLSFEHRHVGYGDLQAAIARFGQAHGRGPEPRTDSNER